MMKTLSLVVEDDSEASEALLTKYSARGKQSGSLRYVEGRGLDTGMFYRIVLLGGGREPQTFYWNGSLEETIDLARRTGVENEFDQFRILELSGGIKSRGGGTEVFSERLASRRSS
jgi:hypothetical protein